MICDRIKEIRVMHKMTQAELAKKIGITRSSVNAWEMGISVPSTQYLIELSTIFNVSTDYLLEIDNILNINLDKLESEEKEAIVNLVKLFENK